MAKKNFNSGIDSLIQSSITEQKSDNIILKKPLFVKATYYLNSEILENVKSIAFYERMAIGKVISDALELYVSNCEFLDEAKKVYSDSKI